MESSPRGARRRSCRTLVWVLGLRATSAQPCNDYCEHAPCHELRCSPSLVCSGCDPNARFACAPNKPGYSRIVDDDDNASAGASLNGASFASAAVAQPDGDARLGAARELVVPANARCEKFCSNPCEELEGDTLVDCGTCDSLSYRCAPGEPYFGQNQRAEKARGRPSLAARKEYIFAVVGAECNEFCTKGCLELVGDFVKQCGACSHNLGTRWGCMPGLAAFEHYFEQHHDGLVPSYSNGHAGGLLGRSQECLADGTGCSHAGSARCPPDFGVSMFQHALSLLPSLSIRNASSCDDVMSLNLCGLRAAKLACPQSCKYFECV